MHARIIQPLPHAYQLHWGYHQLPRVALSTYLIYLLAIVGILVSQTGCTMLVVIHLGFKHVGVCY